MSQDMGLSGLNTYTKWRIVTGEVQEGQDAKLSELEPTGTNWLYLRFEVTGGFWAEDSCDPSSMIKGSLWLLCGEKSSEESRVEVN